MTLLTGCALTLAGCVAPRPAGPLLSAPPRAAADDDIYVSDAEGRIRALSPNGTEQWVCSLPDEIMRADKTASRFIRVDYLSARSGGHLFGLATEEAGSYAGRTFLFAMEGSRLLWHIETPSPEQGGAPLAVGPAAVYEAGMDGVLYAFARTDGHQLWKQQVSHGPLGSPTVGTDGTVYVAGPRHNLHAVSPEGSQRWVVETRQ